MLKQTIVFFSDIMLIMHRILTGHLSLAANVYSPVRYRLMLANCLGHPVAINRTDDKLACVKLLDSVRYES